LQKQQSTGGIKRPMAKWKQLQQVATKAAIINCWWQQKQQPAVTEVQQSTDGDKKLQSN